MPGGKIDGDRRPESNAQEAPDSLPADIQYAERILNGMSALLSIADPLSGEILYVNDAMRRNLHIEGDLAGRLCWEEFGDGSAGRCCDCPFTQLLENPERPYVQEEQNAVTGAWYKDTDSLIEWFDGRRVLLRQRVDISEIKAAEAALQKRLAQQELMFALSQHFVSTASMSVLIPNALRMVGEFMEVSKVVLMRVNKERRTLDAAEYIWYNEKQDVPRPDGISMPLFPGTLTYDHFVAGNTPYLACSDVAADPDYAYPAKHGIKSLLDVPVNVDGAYWGSLSFDECVAIREWSPSDIQLARHISGIISGAVSRHRMEEKLVWAMREAEQSSRAKGEFLSRMSHEIRTPLNAVIGMTNIARSAKDLEKKEYCLEKIEEASTHLLGVINDILDMSKIEANKFELSDTDFDVEKMLMRVVNVIAFRCGEKGQELIVNLDQTLKYSIVCDEQRLAQVVANLLSNAAKFTPEGGLIVLNVEKTEETADSCALRVEVRDTGIGMTSEQLGRLFRPFEQADGGISRQFGGTGLGLAISKSIVELMGGTIWAESEPGAGSTFAFTFRARRGAHPCNPSPAPRRRDVRILAIDDSDEMRAYYGSFAAAAELACETAADWESAAALLERGAEGEARVVFIDGRLAGALDAARRIGERFPGCVPVLVDSAYRWNEIEEDASEAGVRHFLAKPLFRSQIAECIDACMGDGAARGGVEEAIFAGRRILLAEDIDVNREIVIDLLEHTGVAVDCAENGRVAYEMYRAHPGRYDLIFMDIHMPEVDGYEATRMIRALDEPRAREVPIVAMTANAFREDIERCLEAGMDDHISKPIDVAEMVGKLRTHLRKI